ncbi:MAG: hypoxanthine phosphoribosyltransferase [Candidatus Kapaibacterium sp.]
MNSNQNYYKIGEKKFVPFITEQEISRAVNRMADDLNRDYSGCNPLMLIVLKGAFVFAADLVRRLRFDCEIETITAKSYGDSMKSNGRVRLSEISDKVRERDVIIVEDIVDSGLTAQRMREALAEFSPRSVAMATFLSKTELRRVEVPVEYTGIEIPAVFVVGYGLDFAEKGRHLPEIYGLEEEVEKTSTQKG